MRNNAGKSKLQETIINNLNTYNRLIITHYKTK